MSGSEALDGFLGKWRARWPEWSVVEVFVPSAQRPLALAWFSLLQEFEDAMNVAGDPLPADAKLGWWAMELRDWSQDRSRHPLGRVLQPHAAPWAALAEALARIAHARSRPLDQDTAFLALQPLASAVGAVESALFGDAPRPGHVQAIAAHLLASRLREGGDQGVPMRIAGHPEPTVQAWATHLLRQWPTRTAGPLPRRLLSAVAGLRLRRSLLEGGRPMHRAGILWLGWRAARR